MDNGNGVAEKEFERLHRHIFGNDTGDGLEIRMRDHVEDRLQHKVRGIQESIDNLAEIVNTDRGVNDQRHEDNTQQIRRLTWVVAVGVGVMLTLQTLLVVFINRVTMVVR